MATIHHNLSSYDETKVPDASNMCFGIVVSEWNKEITSALLQGTVSTLEKHGALSENIHVKSVPGSFELVYGAHQMVLNGGYDAVIIWIRIRLRRCGDGTAADREYRRGYAAENGEFVDQRGVYISGDRGFPADADQLRA